MSYHADHPLFIYHGGCFDGFTAAWVYHHYIDDQAEFHAAQYGGPVPSAVIERHVIIADFSWPREQMLQIAKSAASLIVLDHHKTAQEALANLEAQVVAEIGKQIEVQFDMNRAGCGMVWDRFMRHPQRPKLVDYVQDRDLWLLQLDHCREYMANVFASPMTFEMWDHLHYQKFDDLVLRGSGILAYIDQYGTKALAEARRRLIQRRDGTKLTLWAVNLPYMNCSDYLSRTMEEKDTDVVAGYFNRGDGKWQFSLRSRNGYDCSEIAKEFGGGGHKEAAGFAVESLEEVFCD